MEPRCIVNKNDYQVFWFIITLLKHGRLARIMNDNGCENGWIIKMVDEDGRFMVDKNGVGRRARMLI